MKLTIIKHPSGVKRERMERVLPPELAKNVIHKPYVAYPTEQQIIDIDNAYETHDTQLITAVSNEIILDTMRKRGIYDLRVIHGRYTIREVLPDRSEKDIWVGEVKESWLLAMMH